MNARAQEGMAHRALSCLLPGIRQRWPPGTWAEQGSGRRPAECAVPARLEGGQHSSTQGEALGSERC